MIHFTKMHGLGNDYIYVNTDQYPIEDPEAFSIQWSRPHTGIGSDGLVMISRSEVADFRMRIFNADGSEAMMCGNASRCIGKYVYEKGLTQKTEITLETLSGIKRLSLTVQEGKVSSVTVDMGEPQLMDTVQVAGYEAVCVSMGNPHAVIFVDDVEAVPLSEVGPVIEHDSLFPNRTNVEFVQIMPDGSLRMRVWERGSGITQACGTGACATAVAAYSTGRATCSTRVVMDGGTLQITCNPTDNHVYMTGGATLAFEGTIENRK